MGVVLVTRCHRLYKQATKLTNQNSCLCGKKTRRDVSIQSTNATFVASRSLAVLIEESDLA